MTSKAIDEIETWSTKLSAWRRDCLRRLATTSQVTRQDEDDLLAMIKAAAGFKLEAEPPKPSPFTKSHYIGPAQSPVTLKGIANVQGINRLKSGGGIDFCPSGLTLVYGRNGSGKSGYVRILRTACRTRVDRNKLKVLTDVYGTPAPQSADIIIQTSSGDVPLKWTPDCQPAPELSQVAVFDSASAQLYVDEGNQIRYLPFGLDLPHRLNAIGLRLREQLTVERTAEVGNKPNLARVSFSVTRATQAQTFEASVTPTTTDGQINAAASFDEKSQLRLDEITTILSSGATALSDLTSLIAWVEAIAAECEATFTRFSDSGLANDTELKSAAVAARQAAEVAAESLFTDLPLPGVGSAAWRSLWAAARDYSFSEAYPGQDFPVTAVDAAEASCVLCQQPLAPDGAQRMARFQSYMEDKLGFTAKAAEEKVEEAIKSMPAMRLLTGPEFADRALQLRDRDTSLAGLITEFQKSVMERRANALARLRGEAASDVPTLAPVHDQLNEMASKLALEKQTRINATDAEERLKLEAEKSELEDRKVLAANRQKLLTRRDLLVTDAAYERAIGELQPRGITEQANKLVDAHLSGAVIERFQEERERLEISHLKVGLQRKSGQVNAEFKVDPQTALAKAPSDILSEGEQRALALAGFLTEVALTDGSGPIIVDDPVSSLDRDRSAKVADRLAEEAMVRQVVVFTHDIIFFNELCASADQRGIEPVTAALFSDNDAAGKIDPSGMAWKGLNVRKRIGKLKSDSAPLAKLRATSPSDYEYQVKSLYGRLRDTYERVVEEVIFRDIVRRGTDVIQTQLLRYVSLPDDLAIRFHKGMTTANTHSHDNPASDTVKVRTPDEFQTDIGELEKLVEDFKAAHAIAESARPEMIPKK